MIRKLIFCLTLFISVFSLGAQTLSGSFSYPVEEYKVETLGTTNEVIYYNYTFQENPDEKTSMQSTIIALQIGNKAVKFSEVNSLKLDSLQETFRHLKALHTEELNKMMPIVKGIKFNKEVVINLENSSVSIQNSLASNTYEYEIETPKLEWTLEKEQNTILGYNVSKATTHYAGRNWVAWYAEDIPLPYGSYLFGGLPGLILEVKDVEDNFHFLAKGIENKKEEVYKRIEKKIVKTNKKKYLTIEKAFHKNPAAFTNVYNAAGIESLPYNPIELKGE